MKKRKIGKYKNIIVKTKDGKFDSKKEYSVWLKLKRKQELGLIRDLKRQVPFVLIPTQYEIVEKKKKVVERECVYIADFVFTICESGEEVICDVKCDKTEIDPIFVIKRKLMRYLLNKIIIILK